MGGKTVAKLYFLGNTTQSQMFGCVVKSGQQTIVIDGGTQGDYLQLSNIIKEKANCCVNAWFFTHPHHDHIGAFLKICKNVSEIRINRVLYNFPSIEMLKKYEVRNQDETAMWMEFDEIIHSRFYKSYQHIKEGDVFRFDKIIVNVLRVFNDKITRNFVNNSSTVYRIDSPENRVLILGDLGIEGGEEIMEKCNAENLYAEYTQLAHHGQNGVSQAFYQYIKPQRCLWASPEWLWNNNIGNGYDSGPYATVKTRQWMEKLGVMEHFVGKDGTIEILF